MVSANPKVIIAGAGGTATDKTFIVIYRIPRLGLPGVGNPTIKTPSSLLVHMDHAKVQPTVKDSPDLTLPTAYSSILENLRASTVYRFSKITLFVTH